MSPWVICVACNVTTHSSGMSRLYYTAALHREHLCLLRRCNVTTNSGISLHFMHCNPVLYQPCLLKMHLNKGHSGARWTVLQTVCRASPIDYQMRKKFVDSFSQKHTTVLCSLGCLPTKFQSGHAGKNYVGEKCIFLL